MIHAQVAPYNFNFMRMNDECCHSMPPTLTYISVLLHTQCMKEEMNGTVTYFTNILVLLLVHGWPSLNSIELPYDILFIVHHLSDECAYSDMLAEGELRHLYQTAKWHSMKTHSSVWRQKGQLDVSSYGYNSKWQNDRQNNTKWHKLWSWTVSVRISCMSKSFSLITLFASMHCLYSTAADMGQHNTIRAFMCFCFQHSIVSSIVCTLFSPRCTCDME